jgi:hypothetical protein
MKPKHALIALLITIALLGGLLSFLEARGIREPQPLHIGSTLLFSVLTFLWFWLDSEARSYKRSPFLRRCSGYRPVCAAVLSASQPPKR